MKKRIKSISLILLLTAVWVPSGMAAEKLTLMLDWFPNVDHLPLYVARHQGFLADAGLEIQILSPSETSDALKLAASGRVDLAVSYQPQTIIAAARGLDVIVIGRLIEHPLTTLLFLKGRGINAPKDLSGKKIGYTVPGLMDALLDAFAKLNGIQQYEAINVGFAIVQSLAAGKVDAVMGPFKTYETVTMAHKGYAVGYFELEKWGIPDYDELIFVTSKKTLNRKKASLKAFQRVIARAIGYVRQNPEAALKNYFEEQPEADRQIETGAFKLTLPYYATVQRLDVKRWQQFADFALLYGLIEKPVAVSDFLWAANQ
ncbi:MAG: ABC transporter substrate-binding protein [Desulfobacterales bacterium]|jgi:putative hydroxymethylpyrimidine transport system substrate-binding protein